MMRWIKRLAIAIASCVAVAIALLVVFCLQFNWSPPTIADGVVLGWRNSPNEKLTEAIQRTFGPGTKEETLRQILSAQGFKPLPPPPNGCLRPDQRPQLGKLYFVCYDDKHALQYEWTTGVVCGEAITIHWQVNDRGEIAEVKAGYRKTCL